MIPHAAESPAPIELLVPVAASAIVYCEANFGGIDGKTANGLVRHSQKYEVLAIIDSIKAGLDSGVVLDGRPNAIPICRDLDAALMHVGGIPEYFIFGMAPASGQLSFQERAILLEAMRLGMSIINGLHEFLNDDPEFQAACSRALVPVAAIDSMPVSSISAPYALHLIGVTWTDRCAV